MQSFGDVVTMALTVNATTRVVSLFKGICNASPTRTHQSSARARPGPEPAGSMALSFGRRDPAPPSAAGGTFVKAVGDHGGAVRERFRQKREPVGFRQKYDQNDFYPKMTALVPWSNYLWSILKYQ